MYGNTKDQQCGKTQVKILALANIDALEKEVNDFIKYCDTCRYKVINVEMGEVNQGGTKIPCCLIYYSMEVSVDARDYDYNQNMSQDQLYDSLRIDQNKQRNKNQSKFGDTNCTWDKLF